jgi:hypothetical protein
MALRSWAHVGSSSWPLPANHADEPANQGEAHHSCDAIQPRNLPGRIVQATNVAVLPSARWVSQLGSVPWRVRRQGCGQLRGDLERAASLPQSPHRGCSGMAPVLACAHQGALTLRADVPSMARLRRVLPPAFLGGHPGLTSRFVDVTRHPQSVSQDRQLPGDGHERSPLGVLAAPCRPLQALPPHIAVLPERA